MNRISLCAICLLGLAAIARAESPKPMNPATDDAAKVIKDAGTLKTGEVADGESRRNLRVLYTRDIKSIPRAKYSQTLTVGPSEVKLDADGKLTTSAPSQNIKLSGSTFQAGDEIRLEFSAKKSWSTTARIGSKFEFTTEVPDEPVQLAISGKAALAGAGCEVSFSSVTIKYAGVEFMTPREWIVRVGVTRGSAAVGSGSSLIQIRPGRVIEPDGKLIEQ